MDAPNASDRKSIRRQEKAARLADIQRREVIGQIMSTTFGRAWLWDQLASCSIFHTTFNGDPLTSAFNEGRRSMGLALLADIMAHCPDQYIQAMREANERYVQPNPDPAAVDPLAERRGSAQPDGGDSGALADQADDDASSPDAEPRWNPGADIYVESAGPAKAN